MLTNLHIKNFILIDKLDLNFNSGLNVISGESGSGKSIILQSLHLISGIRLINADRFIKYKDKPAIIIAKFDISDNKYICKILEEYSLANEDDVNLLSVKRIINPNGNRIYINDIIVQNHIASKILYFILEIHIQNSQRLLCDRKYHIDILDDFSGNQNNLSILKKLFFSIKDIDQEINLLLQEKESIFKEKSYLEYIINELKIADIKEGEELSLIEERAKISKQKKIINIFIKSQDKINDILDNLSFLLKDMMEIKDDNDINKIIDKIDISEINLLEIRDYINNKVRDNDIYYYEERVKKIEDRLFLIKNLSKKFKTNSDNLSNILSDSEERLLSLEKKDNDLSNLEITKNNLNLEYKKYALLISNNRQKNIPILENKINQELDFLNMDLTNFKIRIKELDFENKMINGLDMVEFVISSNNSSFYEIGKIASGGEISRIMLAIKAAIYKNKESDKILIFDEIDAGVSGETAVKLSKRLKSLSINTQIIMISHQVQIIALADRNIFVTKKIDGNNVNSVARVMDDSQKEIAIAKIISGDNISEDDVNHARNIVKFNIKNNSN